MITVFDPSQGRLISAKQPKHDYYILQIKKSDIKKFKLMRTADEHPEQPSAQILRTQLVGLSERVVGKSIVRK